MWIVPPVINIRGAEELRVLIDRPVTIECPASGIPTPQITWLKDGIPLEEGSVDAEGIQIGECSPSNTISP